MPRARGRDHKGHHIPPGDRTAYGQAVSQWFDRAVVHYGPDNVTKHGLYWHSPDDRPLPFEFALGHIHTYVCPPKPTDMLMVRQSYAAAQRELRRISHELMREAHGKDERAWKARYPLNERAAQ